MPFDEALLFQNLTADKFTDNVEPHGPNFRISDPNKEGSLFRGLFCESVKALKRELVSQPQHRDTGAEMDPSPARHNTPADMSGPLMASKIDLDISELNDCHFAKLQLSVQYDSIVSNWSSREEEEAEMSMSFRHSEMGCGRKSFAETIASLWEDEEMSNICIRCVVI